MSSSNRPRRSALYMPGANVRAIEKARDLPCDVVILDLEDAVAPDAKSLARDQAAATVRAGGFGRREVVIRVNGLDTPWGAADLAAVASAGADAVLAPKVSSPGDLAAYRAALGAGTPLWAMIETCEAILGLREIARAAAANNLTTWVAGTNDLAKELCCRLDTNRAPLLGALGQILVAARSQGLCVLDGVYNDIEDDEGLGRQCDQGVAFGFDGKTLIHPRQIEIANRAFAPSADEVEWSRTIVAAFAQPGSAEKGVLRVEGRMVERLHLAQAERLIALAERIAS